MPATSAWNLPQGRHTFPRQTRAVPAAGTRCFDPGRQRCEWSWQILRLCFRSGRACLLGSRAGRMSCLGGLRLWRVRRAREEEERGPRALRLSLKAASLGLPSFLLQAARASERPPARSLCPFPPFFQRQFISVTPVHLNGKLLLSWDKRDTGSHY